MTDFDLTETAREVIATRAGWTLDDLVPAVLAATPRAAVHDAYRTALREFVRQQLRHTDSRPGHVVRDSYEHNARAGQAPGTDHEPCDDQALLVGAGANLTRSRTALFRNSGFREWVHAAAGIWKPLADCTPDELLFAAAENDAMSQRNAAAALRYRTLAKLLQEYDAATPADLPTDVLQEAFGDDRAA